MKRREGIATSADGTRIKYYVLGHGPRTWIAPPAMGAPMLAMSLVYERLASELTIVTWDMRGFYGSADLANEDALAITDHAADLEAVRAAVGAARYLLGGWSMGVPIALEHVRTEACASSVDGLIFIAGPHERGLGPVLPFAAAERPMLAALEAAARFARPLNTLSRALGGAPGLAPTLRTLGLIANNEEFFARVVDEFRHVDWRRYLRLARRLHDYEATHLPELSMPALVVAGERDWMMPVAVARRQAELLPGAELFVVPRGTHYLVSEFPEAIGDRIARFCARVAER